MVKKLETKGDIVCGRGLGASTGKREHMRGSKKQNEIMCDKIRLDEIKWNEKSAGAYCCIVENDAGMYYQFVLMIP